MNKREGMVKKMDRLYIFLTYDIHLVGGTQMFVSGMSRYLEKTGYETIILFNGTNYGKCVIADLNKYVKGGNQMFGFMPTALTKEAVEWTINEVIKLLNYDPKLYEQIYIESHDDTLALWGEILAKRIGGIHIIEAANEHFHEVNQHYDEFMDYYLWKLDRNEIYGAVRDLFKGYRDIIDCEKYKGWYVERDPIGNDDSNRISLMNKLDYNIAYIGRGNKEYVPEVIREISLFSSNHREAMIRVSFVGDMSVENDRICRNLCSLPNVQVLLLGTMVPIPRALFEYVDVVIANSQTAFHCAHEKCPVIVVNSETFKASGVMGYDFDYTFGMGVNASKDNEKKISDTLEDVLVKKVFAGKECRLIKKMDPEMFYKIALEHFSFSKEKNTREYYGFDYSSTNILDSNSYLKRIAKDNNYRHLSIESVMNRNIVIFGAGANGVSWIKWLRDIGFRIYAIVDNDRNKWGTYIDDYCISKPEILSPQKVGFVVINSLRYVSEIETQLRSYGYNNDDWATVEFLYNHTIMNYISKMEAGNISVGNIQE